MASETRELARGTTAFTVTHVGFSGLALGVVLVHALYGIKVGEVVVLFLLSLVSVLLLSYSCRLVQRAVARSIPGKGSRPGFRRASSASNTGSLRAWPLWRTLFYTIGLYLGLYFLLALVFSWAPPLVEFVVAVDGAGIVVLWLADRSAAPRRRVVR